MKKIISMLVLVSVAGCVGSHAPKTSNEPTTIYKCTDEKTTATGKKAC